MGRPDFGRPTAPPIHHHLHDDGDVVDGDAIEGMQHGLPAKPEIQAKSVDLLGFRWRVPLSWVHNQGTKNRKNRLIFRRFFGYRLEWRRKIHGKIV